MDDILPEIELNGMITKDGSVRTSFTKLDPALGKALLISLRAGDIVLLVMIISNEIDNIAGFTNLLTCYSPPNNSIIPFKYCNFTSFLFRFVKVNIK